MKKTIILLLLCLSATGAYAGDFIVNIEGGVITGPCIIDAGSTNQTVNFGKMAIYNIDHVGDGSSWQYFSIKLRNCPADIVTATATFTGQASATDPTVFVNSGTASGLGIQLAQRDFASVMISNGSRMELPVKPDRTAEFDVGARVVRISTERGVNTGTIKGAVQFTITYQ
ncbi:fimbrial protein [Dryocola clanedunensis]